MSNWESWGAGPVEPNGLETIPCNHNGVKGYLTVNKIKEFIASGFEAAGNVAIAIAAHLSAYSHDDIGHANREALDLVSGQNTGDQDLSNYINRTSSITTTKSMAIGSDSVASVWDYYNFGVLQVGDSGTVNPKFFMNSIGTFYNCYMDNTLETRHFSPGFALQMYMRAGVSEFIVKCSTYGSHNDLCDFPSLGQYKLSVADGFTSQQINVDTLIVTGGIDTPYLTVLDDGVIQLANRATLGFLGNGAGILINEAANSKFGQATLVGGTVTINNTSVSANSRIYLTVASAGGAQGHLRIAAIFNGISFTITSTSGTETSVVNWFMMDKAV